MNVIVKFSFMEMLLNIISVLISIVAMLIAAASYRYSKSKSKIDLNTLIIEKEAELRAINSIYFSTLSAFQYHQGREQAEVRKITLEKELNYLKSMANL